MAERQTDVERLTVEGLVEKGGEISRRLERLETLAGLLPRPSEVEPRENAMDENAGA